MVVKSASGQAETIENATSSLSIGTNTAFGASLNGWMDELRITKGFARYPSDAGFAVPTAACPGCSASQDFQGFRGAPSGLFDHFAATGRNSKSAS